MNSYQTAKLLSDCINLGFPDLMRKGHLNGGITLEAKRDEVAEMADKREFAIKGAALVNDDGRSANCAAKLLGYEGNQLTYYCKKFGIHLNDSTRREWDYDKVINQVRKLINVDGYNQKEAAAKIGATPPQLMRIFKTKGYKYDVKKRKINKVKS